MGPGALRVSRGDKRTGERKQGNRTGKKEKIKRAETGRKLREEKPHGWGMISVVQWEWLLVGVITF